VNSSEVDNAAAWGLPNVLSFYDTARASTADVYPSEWLFLRDRLNEDMSVLDIGCAQGGFAAVLAEHLDEFRYVGIDINADMIGRARTRFPGHTFHVASGTDYAALQDQTFDLVLVLGILHLHESWRDTLRAAWSRTRSCLIADFREHAGPTLEDKETSYFKMDFGESGEDRSDNRLPYIVVNSADVLRTITETCHDAAKVSHYGYVHPVSSSAVCPIDSVSAVTWCVER